MAVRSVEPEVLLSVTAPRQEQIPELPRAPLSRGAGIALPAERTHLGLVLPELVLPTQLRRDLPGSQTAAEPPKPARNTVGSCPAGAAHWAPAAPGS